MRRTLNLYRSSTSRIVLLSLSVFGLISCGSKSAQSETTVAACKVVNGYCLDPGSELAGANFKGANLSGIDLSYSNLRAANLSGSDLSDAILNGASLMNANLSETTLLRTWFVGTDLSFADLGNASMSGAFFTDANLTGTSFLGAKGFNVKSQGATLKRTIMPDGSLFSDRD